VDILIETYSDNIRRSYGALCFEGTMHMMDEYGTSCYDETDAWIIFGDPSLQVRTDTPESITVIHDDEIDEGVTTFTVTVSGVENALCAISRDSNLYGYGYTDSSGQAIITFENPINGEEDFDLVVTAYNKIPYFYTLPVNTNEAPYAPSIPDGPASGDVDESLSYSSSTTDFEGEDIYYWFDWGDGTDSGWLGPYVSGEEVTESNIWTVRGVYDIKVKAKDINDDESDWSEIFTVSISNKNPNKPKITGKRICTAENTYEFTFKAEDADGDQIHYYVNWGDNTDTGWVGPFESGDIFTVEHSWSDTGSFSIRAKAKDIFETESEWATYQVMVNQNTHSTGFQQILQKIVNRFLV
jgi:hypothetical protein